MNLIRLPSPFCSIVFLPQDAYVLGGILGHSKTTLDTLPAALRIYEAVRLPFATYVQQRSRMNGKLLHFERDDDEPVLREITADGVDDAKLVKLLEDVGAAILEGWKWSWTTDVRDDLNRATDMLAELGS